MDKKVVAAAVVFGIAAALPMSAKAGFGGVRIMPPPSRPIFRPPSPPPVHAPVSVKPPPAPPPPAPIKAAPQPVSPSSPAAAPVAKPAGGGAGSGGNKPPVATGGGSNATGPANRFGPSAPPVTSGNSWLLWYLLLSDSNRHNAHGALSGNTSASAGHEITSFKCQPDEGQLAKDWVRQCQNPSGNYQIEVIKNCAPAAAETSRDWVERCAIVIRPSGG